MGNCNPSCFSNEKYITQPKLINVQDIENILVSRNSFLKELSHTNKTHSPLNMSCKDLENAHEKDKTNNSKPELEHLKRNEIKSPLKLENERKKTMPNIGSSNSPASTYHKNRNSLKNNEDLIKSTIGINELRSLPPIYFSNGSIYIGQWKNGQKEGCGVLAWPDGSRYEGSFVNDKANGYGKLTHAEGDIYEGQWLEDKANGQGTYLYADGRIYKGSWLNDKQHGRGIEIWPDGVKYQGEFADGKKNGQGMLYFSDGSVYQGTFAKNEIEGFGVHLCEDKTYEGFWKCNRMNGKGKMMYNDGREYEGIFIEDLIEGMGRLRWKDGKRYVGEFKEGKQHGKGVLIVKDGEMKVGIWEKGIKQQWLENEEDFVKDCFEFEKRLDST